MDSEGFFEFDASIPAEDGGGELTEDEEYDALNDETFGSAAVDGDWEEGHEQMASITEASRRSGARAATTSPATLLPHHHHHHHHHHEDDGGLLNELKNLSLSNYDNQTSSGGSAPISMVGYNSTLLGGGPDLPGSPSGSIWTPSPGVDKLRPVSHHTPPPAATDGLNHALGSIGGMPMAQPTSGLSSSSSMGLPTIKTVAELEEEMKLQHSRSHSGPLHLAALRVEDLEREMARQTLGGKPSFQQQPQQFSQQRAGHFPAHFIPPAHTQLNRPFQRLPMNQGNFPGGQLQQQQQQQFPNRQHLQNQHRFLNNFPGGGNKGSGLFNQPHQPHPTHSHLHPHHHNHHESYGNFHHPHHSNHYGSHSHQNYHYHNNNHRGQEGSGGGHYMNHNGYERRSYERRPYDQSKGQYERGERGGWNEDHGGGRTRRDSEAEWEEWHRKREQDEYCGLMTPREKSFLKYIQAMQLHTESPYQNDYYYVMHSVKQQRKREEEVIEIDGLQLLLPDRGKDGGREYEPPRLENSLGKLQVVSVNAPRKIIDLQVVHLDPSHPTTSLQRDMRKHRHLLLYVEKLFNVIMELDDLERKIRHLPDCPTRDLFKNKSRQQSARLWQNVSATQEGLVQLLCVRKGKSLLSRLIGRLGEEERAKLVEVMVQNMALLAKKDTHDQHLALFWPLTDRLVADASHSQLLDLSAGLNSTAAPSQGSLQKSNLTAAFTNKFGVSLVLAMMVRGEQVQTSIVGNEAWQDFLAEVISVLTSTSLDTSKVELPQALPSVALAASPVSPAQHLTRCQLLTDSKLMQTACDRMTQLEVSSSNRPRSQSPVKS